jgi:hypothetical protein
VSQVPPRRYPQHHCHLEHLTLRHLAAHSFFPCRLHLQTRSNSLWQRIPAANASLRYLHKFVIFYITDIATRKTLKFVIFHITDITTRKTLIIYITCRQHTSGFAVSSCKVFIFHIAELVTWKTLIIYKMQRAYLSHRWL